MSYRLVDAGVNLTNHQFDDEHLDVITRAKSAGVEKMLLIGCDISTSEQSLALAKSFHLFSTAGIILEVSI